MMLQWFLLICLNTDNYFNKKKKKEIWISRKKCREHKCAQLDWKKQKCSQKVEMIWKMQKVAKSAEQKKKLKIKKEKKN